MDINKRFRDYDVDHYRTSVVFDKDTEEEIRQFANKEKLSIADAIRTLVEWGLMSMNEHK